MVYIDRPQFYVKEGKVWTSVPTDSLLSYIDRRYHFFPLGPNENIYGEPQRLAFSLFGYILKPGIYKLCIRFCSVPSDAEVCSSELYFELIETLRE